MKNLNLLNLVGRRSYKQCLVSIICLLMLTLGVGNAWGQEYEEAYTLSCSASGSNNSYAGDCDITVSGITWNVGGNSQQNPWRYGGKSITNQKRYLYSKTAISDDITKIDIAFGANSGSITVNSVKLEVYSTAALAAAHGTGDVSSITVAYSANTTKSVTVPAGKSWQGRYYGITMDLTVSGNSNKYITISSITFYKNKAAASGFTVTYNGNGNTGGSVPTDATTYSSGATVTVKGNTGSLAKTGYVFSGWNTATDGSGTDRAVGSTFSITSNTTLYAKWVAEPIDVTLYYKGTNATLNDQVSPYTLPVSTSPYTDNACSEWIFDGWYSTTYAKSTTKPTPYITELTATGPAYAVYKHIEGGGGGGSETQAATISTSAPYISGTGWDIGISGTYTYSGPYLRLDANGEYVTFTSPGGTISAIQFTYKLMSSTSCTGHSQTAWWIGEVEVYGSTNGGSSWTKIAAKSESIDRGTSLGSDISRNYTDLSSGGYNAIKIQLSKTCGNLGIKGLSATYEGGGTTYYSTDAECGPKITPTDGRWVTSTKDKKVKIEIPISATNFTSATDLSYELSGTGFEFVSWGANTRTVSSSNTETSIILQYQPTAYNTTNDATLTISGTGASDATVTIHGRSLPQKFVIAAQLNNGKKWKAVPANIASASTPTGISVETDNNLDPSVVTEDYTTAFYGLTEAGDYTNYGTGVRFSATDGGKMLWGTNSAAGTNINDVAGNNNDRCQEWILNTTDGVTYTIENVGYNAANTPGAYKLKYFVGSSTFGMYASGTEKLRFIAAGCDTPPTAGSVSNIDKNSATISGWSPAGTVTIKLYSDAACTKDEVVYADVASSLALTGLFGGYTYYYKVYSGVGCVSPVGSFTTLEGDDHMTVTEWQEDAVVISFNGEDADLVLSTYKDEGIGDESANIADELFFSKYFEAQGNIKLLGIFNGTENDIPLTNYKIKVAQGKRQTSWNNVFDLSPLSTIEASQEIILISYKSDDSDITDCIIERNPKGLNYVRVQDGGTVDGILSFNGDDAVGLFKNDELIDIIGAGTTSGANVSGLSADSLVTIGGHQYSDQYCWYAENGTSIDGTSPYYISTNLCLLIRKPSVHSGQDAVDKNKTSFVTLADEWIGGQVTKNVTSTCVNFDYVGTYDYSSVFEQYTTLVKDETFEDFRSDPFDGTYTIPVPGLINMACSNVRIDLADASDPTNVLIRKDIQVPIMITEDDQLTTDEIFSSNEKTPEICSTCDLVILSGAVLTKAADNADNDVPEVRDLKIYENGKLVVPTGTTYTVNSLALRRENDAISMVDVKGTLNIGTAVNGVSMDLRTDPQQWHYIALPFNCKKDSITFVDGTPAVQGTDYLLRWYNGEYRAANKKGGWQDYTGTHLKAGHGYIIGLMGDNIIKKELRFPMSNSVINAEKGNKTVGELYAYGGDKDDDELTPNHKGWNLIGNPYMMYYATDITNPLAVGHLDGPNGEGTYTRSGSLRFLVEPLDNGRSGYRQIAISTHMPPFTAYFVQIGVNNASGEDDPNDPKTISFNLSSAGQSNIRRRDVVTEEIEEEQPVWYGVELRNADNEKDYTALLISDQFTNAYDMMDDLVKMRGSAYNDPSVTTAPVLASRNDAGEMAFNALPDESAAVTGVPLNYYAASAGTYTFATDSRYGLENIKEAWLFDATTGQYNDLLQSNYSFETESGDNTTRFRIFVTVDRNKVTTGNDNLLEDGQLSLVAIDHTLILSGLTEDADVYVYDMSGKLLAGNRASANGIWRTNVPATGAYFVRVNSANGQQTLRAIVK